MTIKTLVNRNRTFTEAELTIRKAKTAELVAQGVTVDFSFREDIFIVKIWTNIESANAWVDFLNNTFTPPPISATVVIDDSTTYDEYVARIPPVI